MRTTLCLFLITALFLLRVPDGHASGKHMPGLNDAPTNVVALSAQVTPPYPSACHHPDFTVFFSAYILLSKQEQTLCVQYPFKPSASGETFKDARQWLSSQRGKQKIVPDQAYFEKLGLKTFNPFFYSLYAFEGTQGPCAGEHCYLITEGGSGKMTALLTEGGTAPLEAVSFQWTGTVWLVTDIQDAASDDGI